MSRTADMIAGYQHRIDVMRAFERGEQIQVWKISPNLTDIGVSDWVDIVPMGWDFGTFKYRIKPKPREWWEVLDQYGNMMARRNQKQKAEEYISTYFVPAAEIVHVREVLP